MLNSNSVKYQDTYITIFLLEIFLETILNISLFSEERFYFIEQSNDKILDIIQELEKKINDHKIYLFAETLDKKSIILV